MNFPCQEISNSHKIMVAIQRQWCFRLKCKRREFQDLPEWKHGAGWVFVQRASHLSSAQNFTKNYYLLPPGSHFNIYIYCIKYAGFAFHKTFCKLKSNIGRFVSTKVLTWTGQGITHRLQRLCCILDTSDI